MAGHDAGSGEAARPIIRKVKKKGGHGHHGGSWKVAYADFVTAMMAFFLLLWLLGSLDEDKREEVAEYFQQPVSAIFTKGGNSLGDASQIGDQQGPQQVMVIAPDDSTARQLDIQNLVRLKERLESEIQSNSLLHAFADQLRFEMTSRGLRIQIMDESRRSMFGVGSASMEGYATDLLREIARILNEVPNALIISGHTDAAPYAGGEAGYSNWELSADRANAARRALVSGGIAEGKILRVEGQSATDLLVPDDPYDPTNRRISILLLNKRTELEMMQEWSSDDVISAEAIVTGGTVPAGGAPSGHVGR